MRFFIASTLSLRLRTDLSSAVKSKGSSIFIGVESIFIEDDSSIFGGKVLDFFGKF